jgi:hypothetical protein
VSPQPAGSTSTPHYTQADDETIWRYMDFTKFVDLLSTKSLYFCRADRFDDPFEGSVPARYIEKRVRELGRRYPDFEQELSLYARAGKDFRRLVFINCWHRNEFESAALWKLYLKSNEGIAIESSRDRLGRSVMRSRHNVWTVSVRYIDFAADDPPVGTRWAPFGYKRKSFEHERELRAIVFAGGTARTKRSVPIALAEGIRVKTDLKILVKSIYVSPSSPKWFAQLVASVARTYGLKILVRQSSIESEKPVFI